MGRLRSAHMCPVVFFFFFNDTATTEIYTLSLHDALPISSPGRLPTIPRTRCPSPPTSPDRKSTRLNSSHLGISYAVFCLKKKAQQEPMDQRLHHPPRRGPPPPNQCVCDAAPAPSRRARSCGSRS